LICISRCLKSGSAWRGTDAAIERLWQLGLLTPALNALHMVHLTAADMSLMQRTGISITLCPQWD